MLHFLLCIKVLTLPVQALLSAGAGAVAPRDSPSLCRFFCIHGPDLTPGRNTVKGVDDRTLTLPRRENRKIQLARAPAG
jgi:hypothetical protein